MFYESTPDGYILRIRVTPNASKCAVSGLFTDNQQQTYLKISLHATPEKGKANQELINFLSKLLKQSKSSFEILSGKTDHYKKIRLSTEPSNEIEEHLRQLEENL